MPRPYTSRRSCSDRERGGAAAHTFFTGSDPVKNSLGKARESVTEGAQNTRTGVFCGRIGTEKFRGLTPLRDDEADPFVRVSQGGAGDCLRLLRPLGEDGLQLLRVAAELTEAKPHRV